MSHPNPDPRPLTPDSRLLPPTPRDFDIHRCCAIEHISTRTLAEKHGISQTRVRQVIHRVNNWLAETLPAKTEAQQEQETRLAKHLAAEQLCHQIARLKAYFDGTGDLKYLRQQTRTIAALSRLGTVPGQIEALAADAIAGPYDPDAPQPPWSEDDTWANAVRPNVVRSVPDRTEAEPTSHSNLVTRVPPGDARTRGSALNNAPITAATPTPPLGDCSPSNECYANGTATLSDQLDSTSCQSSPSGRSITFIRDQIEGLTIFERRLLTLNDSGRFKTPDEVNDFQHSLANIRRERASLQLQLSPNIPGAKLADLSPTPIAPLQQTPSH